MEKRNMISCYAEFAGEVDGTTEWADFIFNIKDVYAFNKSTQGYATIWISSTSITVAIEFEKFVEMYKEQGGISLNVVQDPAIKYNLGE